MFDRDPLRGVLIRKNVSKRFNTCSRLTRSSLWETFRGNALQIRCNATTGKSHALAYRLRWLW